VSNVKTTTAQSVVDYLISKETGPDGEPAVLYEDSGEVTIYAHVLHFYVVHPNGDVSVWNDENYEFEKTFSTADEAIDYMNSIYWE